MSMNVHDQPPVHAIDIDDEIAAAEAHDAAPQGEVPASFVDPGKPLTD